MDQKDIQALLLKYREGKSTDKEAGQIHRWYESLNAESRLSLDDEERQLLEDRMLENIWKGVNERQQQPSEEPRQVKWWRSFPFYSGVAAAVVISLAAFLFFRKSDVTGFVKEEAVLIQSKAESLTTFENTSGTEQRIVLEDKSVVLLAPGSKIIYPNKFSSNRRVVQLIGDAFFEITKNPSKPFCVYSGKLITRVLGTSFRIRTNPADQALEVEVVTGKVSVFENEAVIETSEKSHKHNNGVVLTPNQKVTYYPESGHLMTGLVEKPVPMAAITVTPQVIFSNAELPGIISQLQTEYGIEIVVDNDRLDNCTFTGDLTDMTLFDKLDLICKSNEAVYEVKGTRILISGKGCDK